MQGAPAVATWFFRISNCPGTRPGGQLAAAERRKREGSDDRDLAGAFMQRLRFLGRAPTRSGQEVT